MKKKNIHTSYIPKHVLSNLNIALSLNKNIIIKIYSFKIPLQHFIHHLLDSLFLKYNLPQKETGIIYTCLKELITNAVRENIKHYYCKKNGLSLDTEDSYVNSMKNFKEKFMATGWSNKYAKKIKKSGFYALLKIFYSKNKISFAISNNVKVTKIDEERAYNKLKLANEYESLLDFFNDHYDDTGGAGMGLTMISIMLRNTNLINVDFNLLNIKGYLVSFIDIPVTQQK